MDERERIENRRKAEYFLFPIEVDRELIDYVPLEPALREGEGFEVVLLLLRCLMSARLEATVVSKHSLFRYFNLY